MSGKLVRRWFDEVWNQQRAATIDELVAPGLVTRGLEPPGELHGPAGFRRFHALFLATFPTVSIEVLETVESPPDREQVVTVAARFQVHAVHRGGKECSFAAMSFTRWFRGQMVDAWNVCDFHGLERQLGEKLFA